MKWSGVFGVAGCVCARVSRHSVLEPNRPVDTLYRARRGGAPGSVRPNCARAIPPRPATTILRSGLLDTRCPDRYRSRPMAVGEPEMAVPVLRLAHDAGIVAAAGQQEGHVGVAHQVDLVDRAPRRDVVAFGRDGEDRHADVAQHDRPAIDPVAALEQVVVRGTGGADIRCACDRACASRRRSRPSGRSSGERSPIR